MKKQLLILVLFMGLFAISYAQDKKMFAGVSLGFSSVENVSSSFNIGPRLGYWLSENSAIVGSLSYASSTNKAANPEVTNSGFGIGAQYRHGWNHGDNTFFYIAPGVRFNSLSSDVPNSQSSTQFIVNLTPGVDYMMGDRWSINAEIGLLNFVSHSSGGVSSSSFDVNMNMDALSFALWYHF